MEPVLAETHLDAPEAVDDVLHVTRDTFVHVLQLGVQRLGSVRYDFLCVVYHLLAVDRLGIVGEIERLEQWSTASSTHC